MLGVQILPNLIGVGGGLIQSHTYGGGWLQNPFYWYFVGIAYLKKLLQHGTFPLYIYAISFLS